MNETEFKSDFSASVDIPSSQICPMASDTNRSSSNEDDDYYYYYYEYIYGNESYFHYDYSDYYDYMYRLTDLFDNCAKVLEISEGITKHGLYQYVICYHYCICLYLRL